MKQVIIIFFILITNLTLAQTYKEEILKHRENYIIDLLADDRSPIENKGDIKHIQFYEPDESYKVNAIFTKTNDAQPFDLATMNGKTKKYIEYGKIAFTLHEKIYTLTAFQSVTHLDDPELKDYLFLPFNDETNGNGSYINGRYLDLKIPDIKNNLLELDFNKAYNPYCAFSDGYSCPKPPEENFLKVSILAGEKEFQKNQH
jgi:uncharacterized protein (DUF1684 family)